ncbi:HEAT repeat domain-containing protein [Chengkuizengella sp. SCS-71B]|uniref:HEAT repeat domain-containing protein n=1 Tax=Chengkuizengella sp. SCS-71B TaxID=3115290 RepID=UPI0032C22335
MYELNLEQHIVNGGIEEAILIVKQIGEKKDSSYVDNLIENLKQTDSNILRNAIAIALGDIGSNKSVEPIMNLLADPKTKGSRGTLLYALRSLDYSAHTIEITKLLLNNSIEISNESFLLLEKISKDLPVEIKKECKKIISDHLKNNEDDYHLEEALELFD